MKITREKHLDHMVRVVPLIVMGYAIQCYIISGMNTSIGANSLLVLGGLLISMIAGFIFYDMKHEVVLNDFSMTTSFLGMKKEIPYADIFEIQNSSPQHNFGTLLIRSKTGKFKFYFVDEADKVKTMIDQKRLGTMSEQKAA